MLSATASAGGASAGPAVMVAARKRRPWPRCCARSNSVHSGQVGTFTSRLGAEAITARKAVARSSISRSRSETPESYAQRQFYHLDLLARQRFSQPVRQGTPARASPRSGFRHATAEPRTSGSRPTIHSIAPATSASAKTAVNSRSQLPSNSQVRKRGCTPSARDAHPLLLPTTATGDRVLAVQRLNAQPRTPWNQSSRGSEQPRQHREWSPGRATGLLGRLWSLARTCRARQVRHRRSVARSPCDATGAVGRWDPVDRHGLAPHLPSRRHRCARLSRRKRQPAAVPERR